MRLTVLITTLTLLTGCTFLPVRDVALDSVDKYRDVKSSLFNQSINYVCNGASIRDVRELLALNSMSLEDYNKMCSLSVPESLAVE